MNNLEKAKEIVKEHYNVANCGIFNTRNIIGDVMNTIYEGEGLTIDICYNYAYFEVFGLSNVDFKELRTYYNSLKKQELINVRELINISEELEEQKARVNSENSNEWIPIINSDDLPAIHQDVILSLRNLDVVMGYRSETEPYFCCHGGDGCQYVDPQDVLAWQPKPDPYRVESEE